MKLLDFRLSVPFPIISRISFTYRTHPLALIVKNLLSFSVVANSEEFCFLQRAGVEFAGVNVGRCEEIKSETSLLSRSSRSVLSRLKNGDTYYLSSNEWTGECAQQCKAIPKANTCLG